MDDTTSIFGVYLHYQILTHTVNKWGELPQEDGGLVKERLIYRKLGGGKYHDSKWRGGSSIMEQMKKISHCDNLHVKGGGHTSRQETLFIRAELK